jgi:hypothetical protein
MRARRRSPRCPPSAGCRRPRRRSCRRRAATWPRRRTPPRGSGTLAAVSPAAAGEGWTRQAVRKMEEQSGEESVPPNPRNQSTHPRTNLPVRRLRAARGFQIHAPPRPRTRASMRHACWLHGSEPRGYLGKKQGMEAPGILPRRRVRDQDLCVGLDCSERETNQPAPPDRRGKARHTPNSSSSPLLLVVSRNLGASKLSRPARRASYQPLSSINPEEWCKVLGLATITGMPNRRRARQHVESTTISGEIGGVHDSISDRWRSRRGG